MNKDHLELTVDIVSAYVGRNAVPADQLAALIMKVNVAMQELQAPIAAAPEEKPQPAIAVKKSVTPDYIVCLDDGKRFKSLRRHLSSMGMTAESYREKWDLPQDYPMVAPNYAAARSALAKKLGLGRKPGKKNARPRKASAQ